MVMNGQEKGSKCVEMLKQNSSEDEKAPVAVHTLGQFQDYRHFAMVMHFLN